MELIIEPDAGNEPIITAIKAARATIDILIFRMDCHPLTPALESAVARGVAVHVLMAHKNHGGTKALRKLERRLLEAGAQVSRTADDLVRYHGKMMIVDGRLLQLYGFNCTRPDLKSRSFGIVTRNRALVAEALRLFRADSTRRLYTPMNRDFVVSPDNSRERLSAFVRGARRQLLIYDPRLTDATLQRLLIERARAGVDVRVIGKVRGHKAGLAVEPYSGTRLHVRSIVRDGSRAFVGSQSLGRVALDERREIGVIVRNPAIVRTLRGIFEDDWRLTRHRARPANDADAGIRIARAS